MFNNNYNCTYVGEKSLLALLSPGTSNILALFLTEVGVVGGGWVVNEFGFFFKSLGYSSVNLKGDGFGFGFGLVGVGGPVRFSFILFPLFNVVCGGSLDCFAMMSLSTE